MPLAFVALYDGFCDCRFYERITHIRDCGVSVESGFFFELYHAMFDKFAFVFVEFEFVRRRRVAFDKFGRAKSCGNAYSFGVVFDQVDYRVQTPVYGRIFGAKIVNFGIYFIFRRFDRFVDKFRNAFAFRRAYGYYGDAEFFAHFLYVHASAVFAHFVHHIKGDYRRNAKRKQLQRKVQIAFDIRRVHDVYYSVGFFVEYVISCNDFFLRVSAQGINTR